MTPGRRQPGPRDLPGDPGLEPTPHRNERGPYVGRAHRPIRRFAHDPGLERVMGELAAGFGPQRWWPAETPFEVLVGAILAQNTGWTNVELAMAALKRAGPLTPATLLATPVATLEQRVRSSGYFRAKSRKLREASRWYLEAGGLAALRERPLGPLREELLGVWGVGPETADSILCFAAGRRTAVVDTYTRRILGRHGLLDPELPYEEVRAWLQGRLARSQAVFEEFHALCVRAGYKHCKPSPRCESCPATAPAV